MAAGYVKKLRQAASWAKTRGDRQADVRAHFARRAASGMWENLPFGQPT